MNPEAVEWLESLDEERHASLFAPAIASPGTFASLKEDHESCGYCPRALRPGGPGLLVIG